MVLLALEGFLRVSGYVPFYLEKRTFIPNEDPRILYELRPDFQGLFAGVHVTVNSQGFRGKELNSQGTQVYRILLVGDSIAFGQGVEDNNTLAVKLANRLQGKLRDPVEVVNLGVSGYHTCQEYWRLKARIGSLDPQAIIWVFVTNDTDRSVYRVKNGTVISPDTRTGWFGEFMAWLRKSSLAYNLAWTRWQLVKKGIHGSGNYRERASKQLLDSNPEWKKHDSV